MVYSGRLFAPLFLIESLLLEYKLFLSNAGIFWGRFLCYKICYIRLKCSIRQRNAGGIFNNFNLQSCPNEDLWYAIGVNTIAYFESFIQSLKVNETIFPKLKEPSRLQKEYLIRKTRRSKGELGKYIHLYFEFTSLINPLEELRETTN